MTSNQPASSKNDFEVVIYLKSFIRGCPKCTQSDLYKPKDYAYAMMESLNEIGITDVEIKVLENNTKVADELRILRDELSIPEDIEGWITVSFSGRFLFIGNEGVPRNIIIDFIINHAHKHQSIIVYRDDLKKLYKIIDETGDLKECEIKNSIEECIGNGSSHLTTLFMVVSSGLLDGINPCSFAVLLFFIAITKIMETTTAVENYKNRLLMVGSTYILAVYTSYLTIGLGLINVLKTAPFPHLIGRIGALILIFIGIMNVKDFLGFRGFNLSMSASQWSLLRRWMRKLSIPAALVLGVFVTLFEFPCTGGIYLAILGFLAFKASFIQGFWYLVVYNLMFVLPLIVIFIILWNRESIGFSLERWNKNSGRILKLCWGIIMIALGLIFYTIN